MPNPRPQIQIGLGGIPCEKFRREFPQDGHELLDLDFRTLQDLRAGLADCRCPTRDRRFRSDSEEFLAKNSGASSRKTGTSCSTLTSGRFKTCAQVWPTADAQPATADSSLRFSERQRSSISAVIRVLSSTFFIVASRCCFA